jgi:ribonuclease HI
LVEYKGVRVERRLVKGTPQGGVLSPVLWNLAFDDVLKLVDDSSITACGYADDLALIGRGLDTGTVIHNMQQVLNKVTRWGTSQGLRFSPSKSVAIAFTRKTLPWGGSQQLTLYNTPLQWSDQVKYLGVTLDKRLNWGVHLRDKTSKAIRLLYRYKQIVGREFGPHPKYMRWMYTGIIRPALAYGAVVWWRAAMSTAGQKLFTRIARLALLTFGPVRRGTPTAAMEVIGYLPPMDLYLQGEVTKAWLRLRGVRKEIWDGVGLASLARGHRRALRNLTDGFHLPAVEVDDIPPVKKWERRYQVDTDFTLIAPGRGGQSHHSLTCYTDGAKNLGGTGAGYCITTGGSLVVQESIPLGSIPSVFQAEMSAILHAGETLATVSLLSPGTPISIYSDSQAVLRALDSPVISSSLTLKTARILDSLATTSRSTVRLFWIKAHSGNVGNNRADALAKKGTCSPAPSPLGGGLVVPAPRSFFTQFINEVTEKRWNHRWQQQTPEARQSRLLWPAVEKLKSQHALGCDRQEYGDITRLFTGHNHLNRHAFLLTEVPSKTCRLCCEDEESSEHVLCECLALAGARARVLGNHFLTAAILSQKPFSGVRRFILLIRRALQQEGLENI